MERMEALTNYYTTHNEDARLTSKHGMVEFLTTIHYVEKYLKPGMRILEIGAGTGRYSHYFAQNGYDVDSVELMESEIEVFMANTKDGQNINLQHGDAVDLHNIHSKQYDITFLLRPMYHPYTNEDKIAANVIWVKLLQHQCKFRNSVDFCENHLCLISRRANSSEQLNKPIVGSDTGSADSMP